jgi:linoleoyl-CoA desaturase
MKTVKFISDDLTQKQFSIAIRKNVNRYFTEKNISTKGDINMTIKAATLLSIYIMPFIIILIMPVQLWLAFLLVIIMGIGEAGVGMAVMHDAAHNAFSNKRWVNKLFASTMFLLGSNTFNWKVQHNILHHTYTNVFGFDQDIESKATLRLCEHAPLKRFHRWQYIYAYFFYGLMTLAKLLTDISQLIEFNNSGITKEQNNNPRHEIMKLTITKFLYFSIIIGLPIWLTSYVWWQVLIGFSILHITAGMIMSTIFQMAHVVEGAEQPLPDNNGVIKNEWTIHQLRTTSDFARNNIFLNWYAGGLNFQIEHHLFPNICHIHYRKIAPIVEQTAKEFGLTYNLKSSFFAAFMSHAKRLKSLGIAT